MKVGDIVIKLDKKFNHHRVWVIEAIRLGCLGQEGLIELRSLSETPGYGASGPMATSFVPESILRDLPIYTPVVLK